MSLVPYDPFRHMENWRQEVERWLSEQPFTGAFPALRMPRMDVYETENEVIVSAELPGLEKKDDVQIDVDEDRLTISGSVQRTQEVQGERMHRRERYTASFSGRSPCRPGSSRIRRGRPTATESWRCASPRM